MAAWIRGGPLIKQGRELASRRIRFGMVPLGENARTRGAAAEGMVCSRPHSRDGREQSFLGIQETLQFRPIIYAPFTSIRDLLIASMQKPTLQIRQVPPGTGNQLRRRERQNPFEPRAIGGRE